MDKATGKIGPDHPFFELIEEAYRVFESPKPTETGVCVKCCMDGKIEADFFTPPIRDMPLHYIQDWYHGAYDPEGVPKAVWEYLLPRILELLAGGEDLWITAFWEGDLRTEAFNFYTSRVV